MKFQIQGVAALDAIVNVRLTTAEKERLREDAVLAAISMSELVRRQYFNMPISARADENMLRELRRLGGLLKHVHNESGGQYSSHTSDALIEIRRYINKLSQ